MNKYKYLLVEHDFLKKTSQILEVCNNKYNCMQQVQDRAEGYIKNVMGDSYDIKYYVEKKDTNRQYGYFLEKSLYDNNKITVKKKYIKCKGWLWNTVCVDDIMAYYFLDDNKEVEIEYKNQIERVDRDYYLTKLQNEGEHFDNFIDCIEELKKKVPLIE